MSNETTEVTINDLTARSACGAEVESVIGCPDGAEVCQDCFDMGMH